MRVKWDKVPETKRNGIIRGYTIQWRGLFNGSWSLRNITVYGEDNLTVVIEGLEMFVTYKVKALASTTAGSGGFSSPVDAITNQTSKLGKNILFSNSIRNALRDKRDRNDFIYKGN